MSPRPRSSRHTEVALWAIALALAAPLTGACPEPYLLQVRLAKTQSQPDPFWASMLTGNLYLEVDCLDEARRHYREAQSILDALPPAQRGEKDRQLIDASLELVEALMLQRSGSLEAASHRLVAHLSRADFAALKVKATMALADIDRRKLLDEAAWTLLVRELNMLGERGFGDAYGALARGYLRRDEPDQAVGVLQAELAKNLLYPQRAMLLIELADVLLESGRLAEAQLVTLSIESDVGEKLLDPRARIRFLEVATKVWRVRLAAGGDSVARVRQAVYRDALARAKAAFGSAAQGTSRSTKAPEPAQASVP